MDFGKLVESEMVKLDTMEAQAKVESEYPDAKEAGMYEGKRVFFDDVNLIFIEGEKVEAQPIAKVLESEDKALVDFVNESVFGAMVGLGILGLAIFGVLSSIKNFQANTLITKEYPSIKRDLKRFQNSLGFVSTLDDVQQVERNADTIFNRLDQVVRNIDQNEEVTPAMKNRVRRLVEQIKDAHEESMEDAVASIGDMAVGNMAAQYEQNMREKMRERNLQMKTR